MQSEWMEVHVVNFSWKNLNGELVLADEQVFHRPQIFPVRELVRSGEAYMQPELSFDNLIDCTEDAHLRPLAIAEDERSCFSSWKRKLNSFPTLRKYLWKMLLELD